MANKSFWGYFYIIVVEHCEGCETCLDNFQINFYGQLYNERVSKNIMSIYRTLLG